MYDEYSYYEKYKVLKDYIVDIINGEIVEYDILQLSDLIHEHYERDEISSTQYDDLMRYVQDML